MLHHLKKNYKREKIKFLSILVIILSSLISNPGFSGITPDLGPTGFYVNGETGGLFFIGNAGANLSPHFLFGGGAGVRLAIFDFQIRVLGGKGNFKGSSDHTSLVIGDFNAKVTFPTSFFYTYFKTSLGFYSLKFTHENPNIHPSDGFTYSESLGFEYFFDEARHHAITFDLGYRGLLSNGHNLGAVQPLIGYYYTF